MTTQTPMPALYLPHGGGPAFFMQGPMGDLFRPMGEFLASVDSLLPATPSAIMVVSAHWEAPVATVTSGAHPELIFDYFGFPPETYQLTYAAPGSPALAASAADLLRGADIDVRVDPAYGWDHGVFIPLKVMYPEADIPVVAMSLRAGLDPGHHTDIGAALRPLRDEGVLIVGSGMSYHNLRVMDDEAASTEFHRWLDAALHGDADHRRQALSTWMTAPSARASHPREEHLLPLMVASGSGGDESATKLWAGRFGSTPVGAWAFN